MKLCIHVRPRDDGQGWAIDVYDGRRALAVQALYATGGQPGSHRIVSALRAIEAWIREGGAL